MAKITTTKTKQPRRKKDKYYTEVLTDSVVFFGLAHELERMVVDCELGDTRRTVFVEPCAGGGAMAVSLQKILTRIEDRLDRTDFNFKKLPVRLVSYDIEPTGPGIITQDLWRLTPEQVLMDAGLAKTDLRKIVFYSNPPFQIIPNPPVPEHVKKKTVNVMAALDELLFKLAQFDRDMAIDLHDNHGQIRNEPSSINMLLRLTQLELTEKAIVMNSLLERLCVLKRISFTGDGHNDMATTAWFGWNTVWLQQLWDELMKDVRLPDGTSEADVLRSQWEKFSKTWHSTATVGLMTPFIHPDRFVNFDLDKEIDIILGISND
jgi:hypothetical protein